MSQHRMMNEELKKSLAIWKNKYSDLEKSYEESQSRLHMRKSPVLESSSSQTLTSAASSNNNDNPNEEYDNKMAKAEQEVQKLHQLFMHAQEKVTEAEMEKIAAEKECI